MRQQKWASIVCLGAALIGIVPAKAAAPIPNEEPVETIIMTPSFEGESHRFVVQLYDARLLDDPEFIESIRENVKPDEVISVTEEEGTQREPGQLTPHQQREESLEKIAPLERVRVRPGFFQAIGAKLSQLGRFFRGSFKPIDRSNPEQVQGNKDAIKFALISTSTYFGIRTFLLLTNKRNIVDILPSLMTVALCTFGQNRWVKQIGHLLSRSYLTSDPGVEARPVTGIARRALWSAMFTQLYKYTDMGAAAFTTRELVHMGMLTLLFGVTDAWASYLVNKQYQKSDPKNPGVRIPDESRITLTTFWIGALTGLASSADQVQHRWNFLIHHFDYYDFRLSGAIAIVNYGIVIALLAYRPDQLHNAYRKFQDFLLNVTVNPLKKGVKSLIAGCKAIFNGQKPPLPPNDPLPQ